MLAAPERTEAVGPRERWFAPALTFLAIRLAFWLGTLVALVWQPGGEPLRAQLRSTIAKWDSDWYLQVARGGYEPQRLPDGSEEPLSAVFFPLYPVLVRAVATVIPSYDAAGVLVSVVAAALGAAAVFAIARSVLGERDARTALFVLACFPTAFFLVAIYADGLFLGLSAGAFLAALRGRAVAAGVLGALAVATRPLGLALLPALVLLLWPRPWSVARAARLWPLALLPAAAGAYAVYLHFAVGDALAFAHQQAFWGRETSPLGPLGGLWDAVSAGMRGAAGAEPREFDTASGHHAEVPIWNVLHLGVLAAALALTWVAWRRLGAAFGLYSATLLAVALATPVPWFPLQSLPRFLLADFPLFLALALLVRGRPGVRVATLCAFSALGLLAGVAFAHGVWVA
ncbi:MAG: hypothetical protein ICV64_01485 [Thermoleophilia bacterium]|nr:hypothetical protein [Thermoleophilia bacterium]